MEQSNEELEPLFDYSRVQPNFISIDDDDDDDGSDSGKASKFSPKRRKKSNSVVCLTGKSCVEAPKVVGECDEKEEDWLLPPPPMVSKPAEKVGHEDLTLKELRLKKQELASFALSPEDVLRAVEELARKEISSSATPADSEADEPANKPADKPTDKPVDKPAKAHDDRAKIVISIQDKDELKQFRIYMDDKFERLFKMYAQKVKRDIQSLVFSFDGDKISPSATPGGLGLEDDDIIEVRIK